MRVGPGTKLGRYEITSSLGAGGMGEVYRARDTRLGRTVAIKVLPQRLSQMPDLQWRLNHEARAISKLFHPNICALHDIGHHEGTDFLVLEYLEGKTLREILASGTVPVQRIIQIAVQVAEGLAKAHEAGIIHRDLKPENLMVSPHKCRWTGHDQACATCLIALALNESLDHCCESRLRFCLANPLTLSPKIGRQHARVPLFVFGVRIAEPFFANCTANTRRKPADHIAR